MTTPQDTLFFPVRKTSEGKEFVCVNEWGYLPETCKTKSDKVDQEIPHWAKDNPVIRISRYNLVEIA